MEHEPSNYTATKTFTYSEMMEVDKAITDRLVKLALSDDYEYKETDIASLLTVHEWLSHHIQIAVEAWEEEVAKKEALALENDQALQNFLNGDTGDKK